MHGKGTDMLLRYGDRMWGRLCQFVRHLKDAVVSRGSTPAVRLITGLAIFGLAAISIYYRFHPQSAAPCATDFGSMYHSALAVRGGSAPYGPLAGWIDTHAGSASSGPFTDTSCLTGMLEFTYTPFFALMLLPLTLLPYHASLWLWDACELLFLAGAIYTFLRAARFVPSMVLLLLLTSAAVLTSPLRFELYYAQADLFLLFVICGALWAQCAGRETLAGALLAIACASQPLLLVVLLFLVRKREIRFAAITLVVSLALILLPFVWLGRSALGNMLTVWNFYATTYATQFTNNAPRGVLLRLMPGTPHLAAAFWLILALGVLGAALWHTAPHPLDSDSRSLLDVGLFVAAMLLASPWSENGNFTLLLLSFLAVYVYIRRSRTDPPLLGGYAAALALFYVLGDTIQYALHARIDGTSAISYLLTVLDAVYLYPLLAITAVLIYARRLAERTAGRHLTGSHTYPFALEKVPQKNGMAAQENEKTGHR